jgi:hypothetical protein
MKITDWIKTRRNVKYLNSLPVEEPVETPATELPDIDICYKGVAMNDYLVSQEHLREAKARADIATTDLLRIQTAMRPSRTQHISMLHDGLQWVVRLQIDPSNPRNELVGVGDSPEKACTDFDMKWYGIEK